MHPSIHSHSSHIHHVPQPMGRLTALEHLITKDLLTLQRTPLSKCTLASKIIDHTIRPYVNICFDCFCFFCVLSYIIRYYVCLPIWIHIQCWVLIWAGWFVTMKQCIKTKKAINKRSSIVLWGHLRWCSDSTPSKEANCRARQRPVTTELRLWTAWLGTQTQTAFLEGEDENFHIDSIQ